MTFLDSGQILAAIVSLNFSQRSRQGLQTAGNYSWIKGRTHPLLYSNNISSLLSRFGAWYHLHSLSWPGIQQLWDVTEPVPICTPGRCFQGTAGNASAAPGSESKCPLWDTEKAERFWACNYTKPVYIGYKLYSCTLVWNDLVCSLPWVLLMESGLQEVLALCWLTHATFACTTIRFYPWGVIFTWSKSFISEGMGWEHLVPLPLFQRLTSRPVTHCSFFVSSSSRQGEAQCSLNHRWSSLFTGSTSSCVTQRAGLIQPCLEKHEQGRRQVGVRSIPSAAVDEDQINLAWDGLERP